MVSFSPTHQFVTVVLTPDSIAKLEQHVAVLREDDREPQKVTLDTNSRGAVQQTAQIDDMCATVPVMSKEKEMQTPRALLRETSQKRPVPTWMSLLPSHVNPHVKPPSHYISRRISFPFYSSSNNATPYKNPLECPIAQNDYTANHSNTTTFVAGRQHDAQTS